VPQAGKLEVVGMVFWWLGKTSDFIKSIRALEVRLVIATLDRSSLVKLILQNASRYLFQSQSPGNVSNDHLHVIGRAKTFVW
jgi:hypothetical protein